MIILESIKFKNFLSSGNMPVHIQLNKDPMTLIRGKNGQGKSIMLDALCFGLFGKPYRKVNKGGLVNSINRREAEIIIELTANNKKYKIIRSIAPVRFEIYCNGVMLDQNAGSKDYQKILEENILKMNFKSFTQIVILGSASFVPFMKLTPVNRRAIVEDILDIQIFSIMKTIVKNQNVAMNNELRELKRECENIKTQIQMLKKHLEEINILSLTSSKKKEQDIKDTKEKTKLLEEQIKEHEKLSFELSNTLLEEKVINNKAKEMEAIERKIEMRIKQFKKDREFFENNEDCSTCGQDLTADFRDNMIKKFNNEINKLELGLVDMQEHIISNNKQIERIENVRKKYNSTRTEIQVVQKSVSHHTNYINKIEKELWEVNIDTKSDENKKSLVSRKNHFSEIEKKKEKTITDCKYTNIMSELLSDNGIKTTIIKQYLPIINSKLNKYLSEMDFFVDFQLDDEFNETIKSRHRDEFCYESFSEGEKRRLDISILLTWRYIASIKNSNSINLLIMDEILDSSLDQNGIDDIMKLFESLEKTNLFVVSHRGDALSDKFPVKLEVQKKNNFTEISEEI